MFGRAPAKKEGNCNVKVTRHAITWLINLIYSTTLLYLISNQLALFEEKSPTYLKNTSCLGNYLQINAFLASSGRVEKNFLQLKTTENHW